MNQLTDFQKQAAILALKKPNKKFDLKRIREIEKKFTKSRRFRKWKERHAIIKGGTNA